MTWTSSAKVVAVALVLPFVGCSDPSSDPVDGNEESGSEETGMTTTGDDPGPREYVPEDGIQTVQANGIEIAYFTAGEGPLVVLLHGFPDTPHTWDGLVPHLVDAGYRTVAPFSRGYAPTAIPDADTQILDTAADLLALIEALGETEAIVIAHDWGATAAYAAANLAPERVSKLVTLAIPHPRTFLTHPDAAMSSPHFAELAKPDAAVMFAMDDLSGVDEMYARWSPDWDVDAEELEPVKNAFTYPGSLDAALGYYRSFAATPVPDAILFEQTTVPALCFSGSNDGAADQSPFEDQAAAFTVPIEVVTLPTGHFVHREAEAEVVERVLAFLGAQ